MTTLPTPSPPQLLDDQNIDVIREKLESFRQWLHAASIEVAVEKSKKDESSMLDEYRGKYFEPFAEEYLIAGFDVSYVCQISISPKITCSNFFISVFLYFKFLHIFS